MGQGLPLAGSPNALGNLHAGPLARPPLQHSGRDYLPDRLPDGDTATEADLVLQQHQRLWEGTQGPTFPNSNGKKGSLRALPQDAADRHNSEPSTPIASEAALPPFWTAPVPFLTFSFFFSPFLPFFLFFSFFFLPKPGRDLGGSGPFLRRQISRRITPEQLAFCPLRSPRGTHRPVPHLPHHGLCCGSDRQGPHHTSHSEAGPLPGGPWRRRWPRCSRR